MKRRSFLAATGTIGAVSLASGATVAKTFYNDLNTHVLLQEFDLEVKTAYENFSSDVQQNAEHMGISISDMRKFYTPRQIVKKETLKNGQQVVYKNQSGNTISIVLENGKSKVTVS